MAKVRHVGARGEEIGRLIWWQSSSSGTAPRSKAPESLCVFQPGLTTLRLNHCQHSGLGSLTLGHWGADFFTGEAPLLFYQCQDSCMWRDSRWMIEGNCITTLQLVQASCSPLLWPCYWGKTAIQGARESKCCIFTSRKAIPGCSTDRLFGTESTLTELSWSRVIFHTLCSLSGNISRNSSADRWWTEALSAIYNSN